MTTISIVITGDTPTSVSLIALTRDDTGLTPEGVTLPASLTLMLGAWVYSFTDTQSPATGYHYTYQLNWPDGSSNQQLGSIPAPPPSANGIGQITGTLTTLNADGTAAPNVPVSFRRIANAASTGEAAQGGWFTVQSDANGTLIYAFELGAQYQAAMQDGPPVTFTAQPAKDGDTSFVLPSLLGQL